MVELDATTIQKIIYNMYIELSDSVQLCMSITNHQLTHGSLEPYHNIQQQLSLCSVEDLDQVSYAFLPDVEGVLAGRPSHDELPVSRETTLFP